LGKSNQVVRSSFKLKEKIHVRGFNYWETPNCLSLM
jgi:hypothetical protein